MTRIVIVGAGASAAMTANFKALGLCVCTVSDLRQLEAVDFAPKVELPMLREPSAQKFFGDRPYLKKKKGRS